MTKTNIHYSARPRWPRSLTGQWQSEIERQKRQQNILERRAKMAYDAYTVAARKANPSPFIALESHEREGWIAAIQAIDAPDREPR
jgi:hypothetical protein